MENSRVTSTGPLILGHPVDYRTALIVPRLDTEHMGHCLPHNEPFPDQTRQNPPPPALLPPSPTPAPPATRGQRFPHPFHHLGGNPPAPGAGTPAWSIPHLRETFAGYPGFLAPGSRKKPDPVALKSISVGNRDRSTDLAARWSGPNSKHHSKPPERAPTIAAGQKNLDLGRSVARHALHVRRTSAPQCVAQIAGAWAASPPPDTHS